MNITVQPPRIAEHSVDPLFLDRWSARSFTDEAMSASELMAILEAARWAPSAINAQPWRFAWGLRGDEAFKGIAGSLVDANRVWAEKASALVVVGSKLTRLSPSGEEVSHVTHAFDAGAAWGYLALHAQMRGWVAHAMGGFDHGKAAKVLDLPFGHALHAVVAVGRQGPVEALPEGYRAREVPSQRRPLSETAGHGAFPA